MTDRQTISDYFLSLQDSICARLEEADGSGKFMEDKWERPGGGGGRTRVLQDGRVIEKGGVNFSAVHGPVPRFLLPELKTKDPVSFYATGVSIVMHPHNPMVPIIHMNVRYFEINESEYWFGGGIDLTPHYVDEADAAYFHAALKDTCDRFDSSYYSEFRKWADDYFFIPHRNETRGIGGIFFDKLGPGRHSKQELFAFVKAVGETFAPLYTHFMRKNGHLPFSEREKVWQQLRRGRYVEFNLVYDKGTRFGLETSGRTESILMSLPAQAAWRYNYQPEKGSPEEKTLQLLRKGINWL